MKRSILIVLALAAVLSTTGCGRLDNKWSSAKSFLGAISRDVTLYNCTGVPIKHWHTTNEIQYEGPVAKFIDDQGNTVRISGTIIIEGR